MKKIIFSEKQIKDIVKMYENTSILQIAKKYGCSHQTITRLLQKQGIELRGNRKHFFDEHIFDIIDTAEKAYWIGFITADGYINEKKGFLFIQLQYSDIEHLKKFAKFINCSEDKVKTKTHNITGNALCYIELDSRTLVNSLIKLNIRQGKSSNEKVAPIPNEFIKDYIRGIIDGDGNIGQKNINICNSVEVLNYIKDYLNNNCYTSIGKVCEHDNTYRIYICKNRQIVINHLYYEGCICLDRKYETTKQYY